MLNSFRRSASVLLECIANVLLAAVFLSPPTFDVVHAISYGEHICTEPGLKAQDEIDVRGDLHITIVLRIQCGDTKGQIESIKPMGIFQGPQNSKWYKVSQDSPNSKPTAKEHYAAMDDDDIPNAVISVKYKCDESKSKIKSCNPSGYDWFDVGQPGTVPAKSGKMYAFTCNEEVEPKISMDFIKTICASDSKSTRIDVFERQRAIKVQFVCNDKNDAITTCKPDDKTSAAAGGDQKDFGGDLGKKYEIECLADGKPVIHENHFSRVICLTSKSATINAIGNPDEKFKVKFECAPGDRKFLTCQPSANGPVFDATPGRVHFGGDTGKRYDFDCNSFSEPIIWRNSYAKEMCLTDAKTAKLTFKGKSYTVAFVCGSSGEEFESCNANKKGIVLAKQGKSFGLLPGSKFYLLCNPVDAPCIDASKDECDRKAKEAKN